MLDIHIGSNKRKFLLILHTSKTHWKNNKPQMIKITASKLKGHGTDNNARIHIQNKIELPCPYTLLKQYAILRGGYVNDEEPFFVFSNRTPLSARHVSVCLRTIIKEAGFNTSVYSSHSL